MITVPEILYLAQLLAGLTYALGAVLYGSPLPFRTIKQWGSNMMKDGVYVLVWTTIYWAVINFADQVQGWLGASWPCYFNKLNSIGNQMMWLLSFMGTLGNILSKLFVYIAPLSAFTSLLSDAYEFLILLQAVSYLVYHDAGLFIAIGVLLMSLPFRIGRSAGATLIAFTLTFWVGLPFMWNFIYLVDYNAINYILNLETLAGTALHVHNIIGYALSLEAIIQMFQNIGFVFQQLVIVTVILPVAYILLLGAITAGLADAIGGYSGRLPLVIV